MSRIVIASHDAGGAEILSSWVKNYPQNEYVYILDGPAVKIFQFKLGNILYFHKLSLLQLLESDFVLTGTSWASDLEKIIIYEAKKNNVRVCSFLDHWIDYPARFTIANNMILPDEIWVGDREALKIAKKYFPHESLHIKTNFYLKDLKEELNTLERVQNDKEHSGLNILYLCEPISEQSIKQYGRPKYWGYTEFEAIEYFFNNIEGYSNKINEIVVRLHPSEKISKYNSILKSPRAYPVHRSKKKSLIEDCLWADLVVGCESVAMVVALIAGKTVLCSIPDKDIPCNLPHKNIQRLQLNSVSK